MNNDNQHLNVKQSNVNYPATIFLLTLCSFSFALMSLYFVYETHWIGANHLSLSIIAIFAVAWAFCLSLLQTIIGWILIVPMWYISNSYFVSLQTATDTRPLLIKLITEPNGDPINLIALINTIIVVCGYSTFPFLIGLEKRYIFCLLITSAFLGLCLGTIIEVFLVKSSITGVIDLISKNWMS
jgi:hypothetical protein